MPLLFSSITFYFYSRIHHSLTTVLCSVFHLLLFFITRAEVLYAWDHHTFNIQNNYWHKVKDTR